MARAEASAARPVADFAAASGKPTLAPCDLGAPGAQISPHNVLLGIGIVRAGILEMVAASLALAKKQAADRLYRDSAHALAPSSSTYPDPGGERPVIPEAPGLVGPAR